MYEKIICSDRLQFNIYADNARARSQPQIYIIFLIHKALVIQLEHI